jgi:hypothetical protein
MIYQTLRLPNPTELSDNPQLAVLVTLKTTLAAASFALLAAYPELDSGLDGPDLDSSHAVELAYATSIWKQIHALLDMVEDYFTVVDRRCSLGSRHSSSTERSF